MNYGISVLFRAIPLLMALFCFGYGAFVLGMGTDPARYVAGPVVMSLGMICIALFATASTIIRQIIHTYNTVAKYALPVLGYLAALLTFIYGWEYFSEAPTAGHFVAGHVICGVAFITACVATTATSSTRFTLIPANSDATGHDTPPRRPSAPYRATFSSPLQRCWHSPPGYGLSGCLPRATFTTPTTLPDTSWQASPASAPVSWRWWRPSYARYATATRTPNANGGLPWYSRWALSASSGACW